MTNKFFNVELYPENKEILKFWEKDFNNSIDKHFEFLNQNLENQEVYNAKFSEILESMDIFENDDTTEKENEESDDTEKNTIAEYYQRCFGDELPESMINIQI